MTGAQPAEINHQSRNVLADQGFTFGCCRPIPKTQALKVGRTKEKSNQASAQADEARARSQISSYRFKTTYFDS